MYQDYFEDIYLSDDVSNIVNVSTLRHYINIHGVNSKLYEYLKVTKEQLECIYDVCYGFMTIEEIRKNPEGCIEYCSNERARKEEALIKNIALVQDLIDKRENLCGIGTRKVKLLLNKEIKGGDFIAKMYRLALEIEDKNIQAKDNKNFFYKDKIYDDKKSLINELISLCKEHEIIYGYQLSDVRDTSYIIYFELPEMEQISFHTDFDNVDDIPKYEGEWDGKVNSTLGKIELAINALYNKQIEEKKTDDKQTVTPKKKRK